MRNLIPNLILLIGLGLLLFSAYLVFLRHSPYLLSFEKAPTTVNVLSYESPQSIEIPSIAVNLPIVPAIMKGNSWETSNIGVSYLSSSPLPGQKGNSVMYGHNWGHLLGNLSKVKPGQSVYIVMNNGIKQKFVVEYTAVVSPSQTYIIDNTNDSRLTLYTCTGFLDSKRFVVVAKPQA
jgi:LPXTG-site transpeptidase (sortase) family protein